MLAHLNRILAAQHSASGWVENNSGILQLPQLRSRRESPYRTYLNMPEPTQIMGANRSFPIAVTVV
jgi:hypothetical protein